MLIIHLTEKGGETVTKEFGGDEVTIGRLQTNEIVLSKNNVSKRHAQFVRQNGKVMVIDLKSTNGTYINGKRVESPTEVKPGDKIYVGNYIVEVDFPEDEAPPPPPAPAAEAAKPDVEEEWDEEWDGDQEGADSDAAEDGAEAKGDDFDLEGLLESAGQPASQPPKGKAGRAKVDSAELDELLDSVKPPPPASPAPADDEHTPPPAAESVRSAPRPAPKARPTATPAKAPATRAVPADNQYMTALAEIHDRLVRSLDLRRLDVESMADEELRERARGGIEEIVDAMNTAGELPASIDVERLITDVLNETLGLGPLEEYLADEGVSEIMVNNAQQVYIERGGRLQLAPVCFSSDQAVLGVIERIVAPLGRRIDESSPMVDARLKDGSRVNAIIPPLALKGPSLTIRKFHATPLTIEDLIRFGTLTEEMAHFLEVCVVARKNIVISGGTGSGKTSTLNVLSNFIPTTDRIVTIEDAAELRLGQDHVVSLESRPPNIEGKGEITIRDLVRNSLRMRPDRIVVGECRGGEALDMLQAMNTGHDGSLTTLHANTPRDGLSRLETMVLMSGMDLPVRAIRDQIGSAIDIIVQQTRFPDGSRRLTHITEVTGMEGDVITMQDIFEFEQQGFDANGKLLGRHKPTGFTPSFYETLQARGIKADFSIFNTDQD